MIQLMYFSSGIQTPQSPKNVFITIVRTLLKLSDNFNDSLQNRVCKYLLPTKLKEIQLS